MPNPIPLDAPVTMATCFLVVVLVFIVFQLGGISIPDKRKEAILTINPY
jgi:hypothetical protein